MCSARSHGKRELVVGSASRAPLYGRLWTQIGKSLVPICILVIRRVLDSSNWEEDLESRPLLSEEAHTAPGATASEHG